jgi:hypothetical protein
VPQAINVKRHPFGRVGPLVPFTRSAEKPILGRMNFRSSLTSMGVVLPTEKGHHDARREPLLVNRLQHLPLTRNSAPARPVLVGNRSYLRALRAAEMKAWESVK